MSSQELGHLWRQVSARDRDVGVTLGVEVGVSARVVHVGNPGGLQVDPEHLSRPVAPRTWPQRFPGWLVDEVVAKDGHQVGLQWLLIAPPSLRRSGLQNDDRDLAVQVEAFRGQRGHFRNP